MTLGDGAPQLESRFEKKAKLHMRSVDWAAWMAFKAAADAVQRTSSAEFEIFRKFILGADAKIDSFKSYPTSFRPWNNQLRQPILLGTQTWVVARAPIEGFVHQENDLDTLGFDRNEIQRSLDRQ